MTQAPAAPALDSATAAFVEDFGLLIGDSGLPPSVGRVLGLLLICVPEQQSAEALQVQLRLSAGSVSTALTLLQQLGLVQRVTRPGERKLFYRQDPACWQKLIDSRTKQVQRCIELSEQGLRLRPRDKRLVAMRDLYSRLNALMQRL